MATSITNTSISTDTINVDNGVLYVDNVNNRVGVGTASPERTLHVAGISALFDSDTYGILELRVDNNDDQTNNDGIIKITTGSASLTKAELRYDESEDLVHLSYGDHGRNISISSSGNVGIGTGSTAPTAKLDVSGSTYLNGGATVNTTSTPDAWNSSTFKRFETDGLHTQSDQFGDPAITGPNKLTIYNETNWKGGIGLGSGQVQYFSGKDHVFYRHTGTAIQENMKIDENGYVTMPRQLHIFGTPHTGTEASSGQATLFRVKTSRGLSFSNNRVTVPVAGVYMITYQTICQTNTGRYDTHVKINGVETTNGLNENNGDGYHQRTHAFCMYLNANDYITWHNARYYSTGSNFDPWTTASVTLLG